MIIFPTSSFPCFDNECKELKSRVNQAYRENEPVETQTSLRNDYKRVVQLKKRLYQCGLCVHSKKLEETFNGIPKS